MLELVVALAIYNRPAHGLASGRASNRCPLRRREREGMSKTRLFAMAVCAATVMGIGANAALAGDITGKPGASKYIAGSDSAPIKGNSECAYSGLNDEYYILGDTSAPRTQHPTPGDLHGSPNACQGRP